MSELFLFLRNLADTLLIASCINEELIIINLSRYNGSPKSKRWIRFH